MCEAQEALLQIAFEIELQWGSGRVDLGRIKGMATGTTCTHRDTPNDRELLGTPVKIEA
jgi:hypothetical protein